MSKIFTWVALGCLALSFAAEDCQALGRSRRKARPAPNLPAGMSCSSLPDNAYEACFFKSQELSSFAGSLQVPTVDFNWGTGRPYPKGSEDDFSARFQGRFDFAESGTYRFTVTGDDGIRLYVDDRLLIDRWSVHAAETYTTDVTLTDGKHKVVLEYFEATGFALVKLGWAKLVANNPPAPTGSCYPGIKATDMAGAVLETARWVRNNHPEFFRADDRQVAYQMMTRVLNILRHNGHRVGRILNHPSLTPSDNPYRWGSDALLYRKSSTGAFQGYDIYGGWPNPANPQLMDVGTDGTRFDETSDLIGVGSGARCPN